MNSSLQSGRIALVAGATGQIGGHLLDVLTDATDYARIYAVTRRPLPREHALIANRIVRFDEIEKQLAGLSCDDAYCCLGTTMRNAGSEAAFREVDLGAVVAFARAARAAGAQRFVLVSSVGADRSSRHFYLRVKAEAEQAVAALGFPSLDIMQPGLLLGRRRELRPLELLAQGGMMLVNPLLVGSRRALRAVPARTVARAMLGAARSGRRGVYRYTWSQITTLAG